MSEILDKFREEAKEVAAAAHGAARDDKDTRRDELFSRFLTLYEKLNEVIRMHLADEGEKVQELKDGLSRVEIKVDRFVEELAMIEKDEFHIRRRDLYDTHQRTISVFSWIDKSAEIIGRAIIMCLIAGVIALLLIGSGKAKLW